MNIVKSSPAILFAEPQPASICKLYQPPSLYTARVEFQATQWFAKVYESNQPLTKETPVVVVGRVGCTLLIRPIDG